ncbi:hypothetical protein C1H46_020498 [Malus baccata]|uniref:Secreted protein n=1 Tax=Malus baccata TaxID=106549 RepID=A0A540M554_MALBA|nr:hypothetical protein C1H46_020498 [Malus baccata]
MSCISFFFLSSASCLWILTCKACLEEEPSRLEGYFNLTSKFVSCVLVHGNCVAPGNQLFTLLIYKYHLTACFCNLIDSSLLLGLHFRAPDDLNGFSQPPATTHNHESLPADDGVTLQGELLIPTKALLLVTHEPGSVSTAPGPHIRGSPLKT